MPKRTHPPNKNFIPMSATEYNAAIAKLDFNEETIAQYLGFSHRMSIRYADNDYVIPQQLAILLRIMIQHRVKKSDLLEMNYKYGKLGVAEGSGSRWTWHNPPRRPGVSSVQLNLDLSPELKRDREAAAQKRWATRRASKAADKFVIAASSPETAAWLRRKRHKKTAAESS